MDDDYKIYIDRLKHGKIESIDWDFSPEFLGIGEPELDFCSGIVCSGDAYIANDGLVIRLDIETVGVIPCSICNEPVEVPIEIKNFYHVEPLDAICAGVFDVKEIIRESVLLEAPAFIECCQGSCPKRKELKKFLKKEEISKGPESEEEGYHPFADLE